MPTGLFAISLCVKAHWKKKVTPDHLFQNSTEWIGEPKNSDGCIIKAEYVSSTLIRLLKKKGKKHGAKSRDSNR